MINSIPGSRHFDHHRFTVPPTSIVHDSSVDVVADKKKKIRGDIFKKLFNKLIA